jgi:hypothetical protein
VENRRPFRSTAARGSIAATGSGDDMGSKAKSRSMQRGAYKRNGRPMGGNLNLACPPRLTDRERLHFGLGTRTTDDFFSKLTPTLLAFHRSRFPAGKISQLLNARQIRTACGDPWTPRLAWFLMAIWRDGYSAQVKAVREKAD